MADFTLYGFYTTCARVTMSALEEAGIDYDFHMVDMRVGAHKKPEYLAIHPQGKVPALVVDGEVLTENVAILTWLAETYPEAGLLPAQVSDWERAQHVSALLWISAGWHPGVRAIKMPQMWTTGDVEPVRERGEENYGKLLDQLDAVLAERKWWLGDDWSIIDNYFWWAYVNSEFGGYSLDKWENVKRHRADCEARPAMQRALAKEQAAFDALPDLKK